jgi:hypothetical protein
MKAKRTRRGTDGGWAEDMKLKKLHAAREKWLEKQQAPLRKPDDLQLIATCPLSCYSEGEDQGGLDARVKTISIRENARAAPVRRKTPSMTRGEFS